MELGSHYPERCDELVSAYSFWNLVLCRNLGSRGRPVVLYVTFRLMKTIYFQVHFSNKSTGESAIAYLEPQTSLAHLLGYSKRNN